MGIVNERKVGFITSAAAGRGGVQTPPQGSNLVNKVCNTLRPRPFSLRNIPGLGDSHNVLRSNAPSDHIDQGSTLFPRLLEPTHESFPSGQEHIPVAVDSSDAPVLER